MLEPIKVVSIDISKPLKNIENLQGYNKVRILCKWNESPVCSLTLSVVNNICPAELVMKEIETKGNHELLRMLLMLSLEYGEKIDEKILRELLLKEALNEIKQEPLVTVAVCTRDRADQLKSCLDSLQELNYSNLDLVLVDNAPSNNLTKELVSNKYPQFRYICEPRPGLDWARNRAILEAKGEIIAYTDDDVVVDKNWVTAIAKTFLEEPDTMAVTGLVEPFELEVDAHILFEMYGGFGRGYKPRWINIQNNYLKRWTLYGTGQYGTGANMAFRTSIFQKIGFFDNALDVGTVTNGGGDLDMFFRVLKFGYTLKYDPNAIVFHKHRNEYSKLKKQLTDHGIGFYSFIIKNVIAFPKESYQLIKLGIYWFFSWNVIRLLASYFKPLQFPCELIRTEFIGSFIGLFRYQKALKRLKEIEETFGKADYTSRFFPLPEEDENSMEKKFFAVRTLDLSKKLNPISDVENYQGVRIFVLRDNKLLGSFDYNNNFKNININQLKELVIDKIIKIIEAEDARYWETRTKLIASYKNLVLSENIAHTLPKEISVSIVIATLDRPDDLTACLESLTEKKYERTVEIVIVDNNPESGLTPPVLRNFPDVKLINETKKGLSFARNAGIRAATGKIIITTDDDVIFPQNWLENLIRHFDRNDIYSVAGNTLPFEIETASQFLFETYGGLGKGFERKEYTPHWFEMYRFLSLPTWQIGATSNAAFKKEIFTDTEIGYFLESLGAGMPAGVGEDSYMFYKILKSGKKIIYEPDAFVLHKHRRTMKSLRKQIFAYSKGHVAYHLTTLVKDGDFRALTRILYELPMAHISRSIRIITNKSNYTILMILLELWGNLLGPWAYMSSILKSKKRKRQTVKENAKLKVTDFAEEKIVVK